MRLTTLLPTTPLRTKLARWSRAVFAIGALALLPGCDLNFWRMDGHQSTRVTAGPVAQSQWDLFIVTCWVSLVIFVLVGAVLAYATFKFKARSAADEHAEPPTQGHGNPAVEMLLIALSIAALVVIAIPTLKAIWFTYDVPGAETREKFDAMVQKGEAYEITATGYQWWFKFEYPTELATVPETKGKAPLATANELVIPAGRPVRINLRTLDVIHSFWVPKLAGKVDMIPNRANFIWFTADQPGYFWGQCAEFCGDSHAVMRFRVIALNAKDFNAWLDSQLQPARKVEVKVAEGGTPKAQFASLRTFKTNETGFIAGNQLDVSPLDAWQAKQFPATASEDAALIAQGKMLFQAKTCIACHTIRGDGAQGVTAPELTHVGARTTIAGGLLENSPEQMQRWIHNPAAVKPGNKMGKGYIDNKISLTADDELALVAYLQSLK
jgi:cytochrome c oxidase subunit 2